MKKFLCFCILWSCLCYNVSGTAQFHEVLYIDSVRYGLKTCPLDTLETAFVDFYNIEDNSTALWRGYIGYWRIKSNKLYLDSIYAYIPTKGGDTILVATNEPFFDAYKTSNGIFASWYSGTLHVHSGQRIHYEHMGFFQFYEKESDCFVQNGEIIHCESYQQRNISEYNEQKIKKMKQEIADLHPEYNERFVFRVDSITIDSTGRVSDAVITPLKECQSIKTSEIIPLIKEKMIRDQNFTVLFLRNQFVSINNIVSLNFKIK